MNPFIVLPLPTVILGCGIPCSGKTTVLTEVAKQVANSFWIEKDLINDIFMHDKYGNTIPGGIISDYYHEYVKNQSYSYMLYNALDNVRLGKNPILEGNYNKQIRTGYLESIILPMFDKENCVIKIIYCYTNEDLIYQRMITRGALRDTEKTASEEARKSFFSNQPILPEELEKYDHLKVDTSEPLDSCVDKVVRYLLERG